MNDPISPTSDRPDSAAQTTSSFDALEGAPVAASAQPQLADVGRAAGRASATSAKIDGAPNPLMRRVRELRKLDPPSLLASPDGDDEQSATSDHLLVVDNVVKKFDQDGGEVRGLHGVSFSVRAGEFVFITGPTGHGKAQPLDAPVLTPTGFRPMGDIAVGDQVIAADGQPTDVVGVFPQGEKEIFRVDFSDGSTAECTADHLWAVRTKDDENEGRPWRVMSLQQIIDRPLPSSPWFVPVAQPVNFAPTDLHPDLDPYLLGALLGDGGLTDSTPRFTTADQESIERVSELLPNGVVARRAVSNGEPTTTWRLSGRAGKLNPLTGALRELGVMGKGAAEKAVPRSYLLASPADRLAVLQGLCDTDAHACPSSRVEFSSCSEQLAEDVAFLARSLGGTARKWGVTKSYTHKGERRNGRPAWIVTLRLPRGVNPFRLTRKASVNLAQARRFDATRAIVAITSVRRAPAQCIKVAHADELYLTSDFVVTHNTTALRIIRNQIQPDSGAVYLGGVPIERIKPRAFKRKVGFVSQTLDTLPLNTVHENIAMPLQYLRWDKPAIDARVEELLELFSLQHARNRLSNDEQLSGGERQRLAIARAIAHQPDILLCDEPTGNLDEQTTFGVLRTLNRISMMGTTVLCVTHDPQVVDLMKKRVIVVRSGQVSSDVVGGYRLL